MSSIHYGPPDRNARQGNLPRKTAAARRREYARLISEKSREALESGGPEKLDVADLKRRLKERNENDR